MESMTIGFLIFSCLKKKDRCFNIQILADSRTEGESDPSSQGLILHTAIPRPKSCIVLAANFSGSKNRKQMATFHAEEWSFWLNLVKSSSTLSNYFTVIMKKYLHNSKAYQQYADQKYHANLLTHMEACILLYKLLLTQSVKTWHLKVRNHTHWKNEVLSSVLIPCHENTGTSTSMFQCKSQHLW